MWQWTQQDKERYHAGNATYTNVLIIHQMIPPSNTKPRQENTIGVYRTYDMYCTYKKHRKFTNDKNIYVLYVIYVISIGSQWHSIPRGIWSWIIYKQY